MATRATIGGSSIPPNRRPASPAHPRIAMICAALPAAAGLALIALSAAADRNWLDRHILPHMFLSRGQQLLWWEVERGAAILLGLLLVWPIRVWMTRQIRAGKGGELAIQCALVLGAILLSGLASELVLDAVAWHGVDRWAAREEPLREPDARLGWTNRPGRTGFEAFGGHRILYHIDAGGHRLADPGGSLDPARPSILFAGESIMFGFRLNWPETIAGRMQAATGLQSVNLAVNGYGTDQAYMRLSRELPHFTRPAAVVMLFAPSLLERNLLDDRPYLDTALHWHPAQPHWRLQHVIRNVILYHGTRAIDDGIARTRTVLRATVSAARARHAEALILVPCFLPEQPAEREIRRRVLDDPGLPYVFVPLDSRWRLAGDGHPDAQANRAMADALRAALERRRPDLFGAG